MKDPQPQALPGFLFGVTMAAKVHRIVLSNNEILYIEEEPDAAKPRIHIAAGNKEELTSYVCSICSEGVLVSPNSGNATHYLTKGLKA